MCPLQEGPSSGYFPAARRGTECSAVVSRTNSLDGLWTAVRTQVRIFFYTRYHDLRQRTNRIKQPRNIAKIFHTPDSNEISSRGASQSDTSESIRLGDDPSRRFTDSSPAHRHEISWPRAIAWWVSRKIYPPLETLIGLGSVGVSLYESSCHPTIDWLRTPTKYRSGGGHATLASWTPPHLGEQYRILNFTSINPPKWNTPSLPSGHDAH